jgi:hypothetical protein
VGLILVAGALDDEEQLQEFRNTGQRLRGRIGQRTIGALPFASQEQGKTKNMSFSEKLVDGLAVSILLLGFVTGVIAKPMNKSPHEITLAAHSLAAPSQQNQDARRAVLHS